MKIGIVTYHRTLNYGAVMQALATRFVLENMDHEAYYVDYWPDYHREMYAIFPMNKFRKFDKISLYLYRNNRYEKYYYLCSGW